MSQDQGSRLKLRYGLNPQQRVAFLEAGAARLPIKVLSGSPGYINMLDALRSWRLVRELSRAFGAPAAASFKHVNPAGVGLGSAGLAEEYQQAHFFRKWGLTPLSTAYLRARHADRISSYGDFAALSERVDVETARILRNVASDGVIAPAFDPKAAEILSQKRDGRFLVLEIDPSFEPDPVEMRDEFGLTLTQDRDTNAAPGVSEARVVSERSDIDAAASRALLLGEIVARHTQSNAVVVATPEQTLGIGAGQQSRIMATRLACEKAELALLYEHPQVRSLQFHPETGRIEKMNLVENFLRYDSLSHRERTLLRQSLPGEVTPLSEEQRRAWIRDRGRLCMASDAFIPFRDNVDRAASAGVSHIIQTGGSLRDQDVTDAANEYGMVMLHSGVRYFLH